MERLNLLDVHGKRRVERWRWRAHHGAFDQHLSLGWLPDGRWWVDATWERHVGWVSANEAEIRTLFAELLSRPPDEHYGAWEQVVEVRAGRGDGHCRRGAAAPADRRRVTRRGCVATEAHRPGPRPDRRERLAADRTGPEYSGT